MKQSSLGLGTPTKRTRRREFLDEMDWVVPWSDLVAEIASFMPEGNHDHRHSDIQSSAQLSATQMRTAPSWLFAARCTCGLMRSNQLAGPAQRATGHLRAPSLSTRSVMPSRHSTHQLWINRFWLHE